MADPEQALTEAEKKAIRELMLKYQPLMEKLKNK